LRFADAFKPRWIALENVVHMRPWSRYATLLTSLKGLGYHVAGQGLEGSDYGVPQSRRRLFIVADRRHSPQLVSCKQVGRKPTARSVLDPAGTWRSSPLFKQNRATATL